MNTRGTPDLLVEVQEGAVARRRLLEFGRVVVDPAPSREEMARRIGELQDGHRPPSVVRSGVDHAEAVVRAV